MPASLASALAKNKKRVDPARSRRYTRLQKDIHDRLIEYLDLRRMDMDRLGDEELWRRTEKAIRDIIDQMEADGELPDGRGPGGAAHRRHQRGAGPGAPRGVPRVG